MFARLGAPAVATTSAGFAFSKGNRDWVGVTGRKAALDHAREMVEAVACPVSADLEDGFGPTPEDVAETVRGAIAAGLAGCTIEDTTGDPDAPIHDFGLAVERVSAAVETARTAPGPFMLTARSENFLHGRPDFDDTLRRLQAFEAEGADVLYAPGLPDMAAIRTLCAEVSRPVNVVIGIRSAGYTVAALAEAGVHRISLGSALARLAYGAAIKAMRAAMSTGDFAPTEPALSFAEIEDLIKAGTP